MLPRFLFEPPLCELFGLAFVCAGTARIGWLVLSARYGSALELWTIPGLGSVGTHWLSLTGFTRDPVLTTDGRHTIVVGGITVVTVLLTDGVTVELAPLLELTVLVIRLSLLMISGVKVTSSSSLTCYCH